jgi:ABC-type transport system substrate-binding protein
MYQFDHPIQAVAAGAGRVLVQLLPGETFDDLLTHVEGDVAKLFVGSYALDPLDAALVWSDLGKQVAAATCIGLLRYAEDGETLEPEAAAAMPTVSGDGRTYTFAVRSGYRFSPPSGEEVTAETFRHSIERALSPRFGPDAPGAAALYDIEGSEAYRLGEENDISGLSATRDTLVITLVAPSADFLERLTSPYFCPVPAGTPAIAGTGGAQIPIDGVPGEVTIPSAGPYFVSRFSYGDYAILLRNPNYAGPRSHRFDAIVLREGVDLEQARALVESGEWDGIVSMFDGLTPVPDVFSSRLGCLAQLPDGFGIDLASLCPTPTAD